MITLQDIEPKYEPTLDKKDSTTIETKKDEPKKAKDRIKSVNKKLKENCFSWNT